MILGIESTAHTFGIGVVNKGKILANVRDMYTTKEGGIIPTESAQHHKKVAPKVYQKALDEANISPEQIKAIAVSNAPGLAPCLHEGVKFAQALAKRLKVQIIPVNHCVAHLEIGQSVGAKDPVLLYASGANTQIIAYAAGKYRVFGETLDIGIGNFIDKVARHFGMGFPGGPEIEKKALKGKYIELPYSIKGMDVSFSGLQTKLQQLYDKGEKVEDLSYSLQETAFSMLVEAAERALAHTGKTELVLGGGVACNSRLQEMCQIMCKERIKKTKFFCPSKDLLVDNAAMIAFNGEIMFNAGISVKPGKVEVKPRERTDHVNVTWR
ncbi:MAG: tRNA (adenosine(37)-N6)-threonylcarbamoyltransferase complex transferase subunit TsaD [Nanoarchaeota archaeon]|nr:tRNA (adenosine(37)-N6)-threonylcarbamoyltransferase complex transferase subunit TsaD [Nanoarchaeota archaeon]MBU1051053.1 tRNA (adenosine(37)-N6)-threonylcarbamoyltransferase complex transferase subunit TsaD [Nanoarchaeota archaeon]MBU1988108.1 tRNA (adenosine(37)-N6)-threonylcarbamoyltransferase complex transferase subunit TsaD [Nanoarchaeota archaeon]